MKGMARFSAAGAALIAAAAGVMAVVYGGADERRAILVSALVAFAVQLLTFAIVRLSAGKNVIAGWGVGAILRFLVFVVYALVVVKAYGLPSTPAMLSMAVFLFLSTLVEPLFLNS